MLVTGKWVAAVPTAAQGRRVWIPKLRRPLERNRGMQQATDLHGVRRHTQAPEVTSFLTRSTMRSRT